MCNLSDGIYKDGITEGWTKNELKTHQKNIQKAARYVLSKRVSIEDAVEFFEVTTEEISAQIKKIQAE